MALVERHYNLLWFEKATKYLAGFEKVTIYLVGFEKPLKNLKAFQIFAKDCQKIRSQRISSKTNPTDSNLQLSEGFTEKDPLTKKIEDFY